MYKFLTVILLSWLWILPAAAAEPQEEQAVDPWAFELSVQPKRLRQNWRQNVGPC